MITVADLRKFLANIPPEADANEVHARRITNKYGEAGEFIDLTHATLYVTNFLPISHWTDEKWNEEHCMKIKKD